MTLLLSKAVSLQGAVPQFPFAELTALASVIIAVIALYIAYKQTSLNRKAIQAQTFLTVVNTARDIGFSRGMDIIRSFRYSDYDEFLQKESKEARQHVREIIDFLNDLMHMIKHGYLTEEHVLSIYYISILACAEHLLPWWVDGFRREHGSEYYYSNFQRLCQQIKGLGEGKVLDWDEQYKLG